MEASKTRLSRAQKDIKSLEDAQQEQEEANTRLKEKLSRLEVGHTPQCGTDHQCIRSSRHI